MTMTGFVPIIYKKTLPEYPWTIKDFKDHIDYYTIIHDIDITKTVKNPWECYSRIDFREISITKIKCEETYISAMHELGHVILSTRDEVSAWKWAKNHSLYWSDLMQEIANGCLKGYGILNHDL